MTTTEAGEPLWTTPAHTAGGGPRIVGDTVVSYTVVDGALMLSGFDLETGKEKWSRPGVTGAHAETYAVDLRLLAAEDGTPLIVNVLAPGEANIDADGSWYLHPIELIDVASGEVTSSSEAKYWIGPVTASCVDEGMACALALDKKRILALGVNESGEFVENPLSAALPEFEWGTETGGGLISGITKDGVPTAALLADGAVEWTIPLAELGQEGLVATEENNIGFADHFYSSRKYDEEGVILTDGRPMKFDALSSNTGEDTITALDASTGDVLWSVQGEACFPHVICDGKTTVKRDSEGKNTWQAGDYPAWGFDPKTGEELWKIEIEGLRMHPENRWLTAGDRMAILDTENGQKLLDTQDGALTDVAEEHTFGCWEKGEPFQQVRSSRTDLPVVDFTGNYITAACSLGGMSTDPADFSQAVVAGRAAAPFGAGEDWDVFEPQLRVIATQDGLAAYRF